MNDEEDFLVPQNSFVDDRETSQDTLRSAKTKSTHLSYGRGHSRDLSPLSRTGYERFSPNRTHSFFSELSLAEQESFIKSTRNNSNNNYDREMLLNGHSVKHDLKSRLYNRPLDSDVFKSLNTRKTSKNTRQALPHPPHSDAPVPGRSCYKTTMFRKKQFKSPPLGNIPSQTVESVSKSPVGSEKGPPEETRGDAALSSNLEFSDSEDIRVIIYKLRKRLEWPCEGIQHGKLPTETKTIDTMKRKQIDDGKFVYCIDRDYAKLEARYNPYDLKVASPSVIKSSRRYFTVSASYVTMVIKDKEPVITPVLDWLQERNSFFMIFYIPFFAQFRLRKTFSSWKHNVRIHKNTESKFSLMDSLLSANTVFQSALLDIRYYTESACNSGSGVTKSEEVIFLLDTDWYNVCDLDQFCERQHKQVKLANDKLGALRNKIINIVKQVCQQVIEMEKVRIEESIQESEEKPIIKAGGNPDAKAKSMQLTKEKYGLGEKSSSPMKPKQVTLKTKKKTKQPYKYTKLAMWRTVYERLRTFIRCVDFLVMELLKRLATTAVADFVQQIETSVNLGERPKGPMVDWREEKEKSNRYTTAIFEEEVKIVAPVFNIRLVLEHESANKRLQSTLGGKVKKNTKPRKGVTFSPKQRYYSSPDYDDDDYDDDYNEDDDNDDDDQDDVIDENSSSLNSMQRVRRGERRGTGIHLCPSYQDLESKLLDVIYRYEQTVAMYASLLKEPRLSEYINDNETGIELECDKEDPLLNSANKNPWPSIELLFGNDADYQRYIADLVHHISVEVNSVKEYSKTFDIFCDMVQQAGMINVDKSLSEKEWSAEQFNSVLSQFTEQVTAMASMVDNKRQGMFLVHSDGFRSSCLPFPERIVASISKHLPEISCARNESLLKIIKSSELRLDRTPVTVEEFVDHLAFLSKMSYEIPALEKEYNIVTRLFQTALKYSLEYRPEDWALYQTLSPSFGQLKATILYCEAKKDENIQKFMKDLKTMVTNLRKYLHSVKNKVRSPVLLDEDVVPQAAMENIRMLMEDVEIIGQRARNFASYQDRFGDALSTAVKKRAIMFEENAYLTGSDSLSVSSVSALQSDLTEVERDLTLRKLLWESMKEWETLVSQWKTTQFDALIVDDLQRDVTRFVQTVFLLEKGLPPNPVVPQLKDKVMNFKQGMPVISSLRNNALRERHWNEIQEIIGTKVVRDKAFTLGDLLQLKIFQHKESIADISSQASNEATLEQMLRRVMGYWYVTDFQLVAHGSRDVAIIVSSDEIIISLEESQVTLGNIKGSRFSTPIKAQVEEWERKLILFARTFEEWILVQKNWLYLETIFSAADIQRQLPNESKLFNVVDKNWKDIMRRVIDNPNALRSATAAGVLEILQSCNSNLEKVHRSLEDYLETKRLVFARFYFLSNEELLDILANTKNPAAVQPHLKKCFGNVKALHFQKETRSPPNVVMMISEEDEHLHLAKGVRASGPVEQWLVNVENTMFDTVKLNLKKAITDYDKDEYMDWVMAHPGQVVIAVTQIMFSRLVTTALYAEDSRCELVHVRDSLIGLLSSLVFMVTHALAAHKYQTIVALIITLVHSRDIVTDLIESCVSHPDDFAWSRHLRYDWDDEGNTCRVTQSLASFIYGYEYLGCSSRLVITPLTDRCYLTLTGALHLNLGGAPAGPAGTGKTETVKDLAKAMGKQCLVFNCSEGLDFKMIGKFLSGLAQSGSWCCFDEFNRIDIEVLSVVAQQLHSIKVAKDATAVRFFFEGRDIRLNASCGIFITMNPGYAGRVDLPDNLKSLFRPVAMVIPGYALIAEIILFSEGFKDAASLSRKLINIYELASKQLSQQDHYDFGLRAVKSVLVLAGQKHRVARREGSSDVLAKEEEAEVLINAIKNASLPKFISDDVIMFEKILADIFPNAQSASSDHAILEKAVGMALRELSYQKWPSQTEKVVQFHDTLLVRHGVMLVGPTGGGKTTVRKILRRALTILPSFYGAEDDETVTNEGSEFNDAKSILTQAHVINRKAIVDVFCVNPKCVSLSELYGQIDQTTMEWTDGLLASSIRTFSKGRKSSLVDQNQTTDPSTPDVVSSRLASRPSHVSTNAELKSESHEQDTKHLPQDWQWVILDGPVDTLWIENLNTVLDDTKILCLANGERIPLNSSMRMVFEVDSLSQASPATISRCGMVYLDPSDLGWQPYVRSWLNKLREKKVPEQGRDLLHKLFEYTIDIGLRFVEDHSHFISVHAPSLSIVATLCNILGALIDHIAKEGGFGDISQDQVADSSSTIISATDLSRSRPASELNFAHMTIKKPSYLERNPHHLSQIFAKIYVFAYIWSFGGNFNCPSDESMPDIDAMSAGGDGSGSTLAPVPNVRNTFDTFVRDLFESNTTLGVRLPSGSNSLYNYYVDFDKGQFTPWENLVPSTEALIEKYVANHAAISDTSNVLDDPMPNGNEIEHRALIPTIDTVQYSFIISLLALNDKPVLLTGDTGVGKTALLRDVLKRLSQDGGAGTSPGTILGSVLSSGGSSLLESIVESSTGKDARKKKTVFVSQLQFSAQTSTGRTRKLIESKLVKRGRDTLGAKPGKKIVIFVDDLNMPQPERYGAQPPIEVLRSFLDFGGFNDSKSLQWKEVLDVTMLASCGPPGGGRHAVSKRLLRNFSILCLPPPSTYSLHHIYGTILGRFLQPRDFFSEVKTMCHDIVSAAISIYRRIDASLKPTPSKCHYLFNLRDLSKVVEGLLQAHPSTIKSREHWVELLAHENARVFYDRLRDEKDRIFYCSVLTTVLKDTLKVKWTSEKYGPDVLLFGDFLDINAGEYDRLYRRVRAPKQLAQVLEDYRDRASIAGKTFNQTMVFFPQTVQHITRAARVFRQREGHILLVGIGGTGKTSVAELAAYIEFCTFTRPSLTRNYNHSDFRDDLKKACMTAGVGGEKVVLFLSDPLIAKEVFLEDVCSLLNISQAPDIFEDEDIERIALELKKNAIEHGVNESKETIFDYFLSRLRTRLHLVFSTSPSGSLFRQRCRVYPSLINCCTIDWYDEWPSEALQVVAETHLSMSDFTSATTATPTTTAGNGGTSATTATPSTTAANGGDHVDDEGETRSLQLHKSIAAAFVHIHKSVELACSAYLQELRRHFHVTPRSYIEFIQLYIVLLRKKKNEYEFNLKRMTTGLSKVAEANETVKVMKEELINLGPILEQRAKDTEALMAQLAKDREAVDKVRFVIQREEDITDKEAKQVEAIAESARKDLDQALPQLDAAIEMLDALNKYDIVEVRAYMKPPTMVMTVMSAVCILLGQKTDWSSAKLLLGEQGFLKRLVSYDRDSMTDRTYERVKKVTRHPDFNPTFVGKISKACRSMCAWVLALQHYTEVQRMVLPKQKKCEEAQDALAVARENLEQKRAALKQVQDQLDSLLAKYEESFAELELLKNRKEQSIIRLNRAAILTKSLASEQGRWAESVEKLQTKSDGLYGNSVLAAASISYAGAFSSQYRQCLFAKWLKTCKEYDVPLSDDYDLVRYLTEPTIVQDWMNHGLPRDQISVENAIFINNTCRWPYIIDPQAQAIKWVYEMEAKNGLKSIKASDTNFMKILEPALRLGEPVIIEDAPDALDPALDPILDINVVSSQKISVIRIGETEVEFNPNFRLYIATQTNNPQLLPEMCIKVCVVNFTVTFEGLQDQLLSNVVQQERPDLENQRCTLLETLVDDRRKLREIEDRTLDLLSTSIGNVLDDEDLINTLDNSKDMVSVIQRRLADSEETQKKINNSRIVYSPVADRGAILYFVLSDLASVDVMYQFSLNWFISLFSSCITMFESSTASVPATSEVVETQHAAKAAVGKHKMGRKPSLVDKARAFAAKKQHRQRHPDMTGGRHQLLSEGIERYLETMIDLITKTVYWVVSRALFARHQMLFSFYMCARIHMHKFTSAEQFIDDNEWSCFLHGSSGTSIAEDKGASPRKAEKTKSQTASTTAATGSMGNLISNMARSPAKWIPLAAWKECRYISELIEAFAGVCSHIANNPQYWVDFSASDDPFVYITEHTVKNLTVGGPYQGWSPTKLSSFQKLILIKILRPECLISSIREYVVKELGLTFVTPSGFGLREFFEDSNCRTPLVFILSPGSDPTAELLRFVKDVRGSTLHLDLISLGRGQGPKAEELIRKAYSQKGRWVFLQNCHLAGSFMPKLQEIIRSICNPDVAVDPQFRLWLSSKPDAVFPPSILKVGLKMTVEPPPGLKANLQRSLANVSGIMSDKIGEQNIESANWKRLLYGLCFFNAVVQERRKFGPLGWNIPYEFINSDLEVSVLMFHNLVPNTNVIPWNALKLLTGEIIYGGRVTDDWDQRCLLSLLGAFLDPETLLDDHKYLGLDVFRPPKDDIDFDEISNNMENFPFVDPPEIFGMHQNANIEHLKQGSKKIIKGLVSMQPRTSHSIVQGLSNDDYVLGVAVEIGRTLPLEVPVHHSSASRAASSISLSSQPSKISSRKTMLGATILSNDQVNESAMVAFLKQEFMRYNELLFKVNASLDSLYSAVKGDVVMSEVLEATYTALLHNEVPLQWKSIAYSSNKPLGSWIENLVKRVGFIARWVDLIKSSEKAVSRQPSRSSIHTMSIPSDQPRTFWLPAFYFPQGFLTAVLQTHARKHGLAVDHLTFEYTVTERAWSTEDAGSDSDIDINSMCFQGGSSPKEGIIIAGLFLDGARWSLKNNSLKEAMSKQRFAPLPEIHFLPVKIQTETVDSKPREAVDSRSYVCPLYQTSSRAGSLVFSRHSTNFIASVRLNTALHEDHWTRRGVALLCQTDD